MLLSRRTVLTIPSFLLPSLKASAQTASFWMLETDAHLQRVENLFLDSAHGRVVSVSTDRTARFWGTETGALLQTIVLAAPGTRVDKSGLSPSGDLLAVGLSSESKVLALFNTSSGAPEPRELKMPGQVSSVAFAPDGSAMAVATWDQVRVFSLPELTVRFEDSFADVIWALNFDRAGRLAAGSFGGEVRLYDPQGKIRLTGEPTVGTEITDLRFSPDGRQLAAGFNSGEGNEVLDVPSLQSLRRLQPSLTGGNEFARVRWSEDGDTLFTTVAGQSGAVRAPALATILRWDMTRLGAPQIAYQGEGNLLNFVLVPIGGEPAIAAAFWSGAVDCASPSGVRWRSPRTKLDLEAMPPERLLLSSDGSVVELDASPSGWFSFGLREGVFRMGRRDPDLSPPIHAFPGLTVLEPFSSNQITINGQTPALDRWESINAWAIDPAGDGVILATRWAIRRFGRDGRAAWTTDAESEAWAVNVSGDGRFVVAAMGDGTLRWLRARDGHLAFTLFLHADGQRWLAWLPDGAAGGSAGAGDMMRFLMGAIGPTVARAERELEPGTALLVRALDAGTAPPGRP